MSSLVATAIRFAASRAITGRTYAGSHVYDSAIAPLDSMLSESLPFVVISTEDEVSKHITGYDVWGGEREVNLVIEVAIANTVAVDGGDAGEIVIPGTDPGLELTLALIIRQTMDALFRPKESGWQYIFRVFAPNVRKVVNRRGVGNEDGSRFAVRQIVLTLDVLHDPHFGFEDSPDEIWGMLLAAMEADATLAAMAPLFRAAISGSEMPDWQKAVAEGGLSFGQAERIGLGGLTGEVEEPALASEAAVDVIP